MPAIIGKNPIPAEVSILAKLLSKEGKLPREMASYILTLGFSADDKARMHDLAVGNQMGELNITEMEELLAFGKAGTLLSILKSRARRTLQIKRTRRKPV